MSHDEEEKRARDELAAKYGGGTYDTEAIADALLGGDGGECQTRRRVRIYVCAICYQPIDKSEPFFGTSNKARHRTCASALRVTTWTDMLPINCPGCGERLKPGDNVVGVNHEDPAKDGAWHQHCADGAIATPSEAIAVFRETGSATKAGLAFADEQKATDAKKRSGRLGAQLSKVVAATPAPKAGHDDHNVALFAVEGLLDDTDTDFAIVVTFKRHPKQGVAFRVASGAGLRCDPSFRTIAGEIAEATSEAIAGFLHTATGQNVIMLDRKDSPKVDEPT